MSRYASVYFSPDRGAADTVIGFIDRTVEQLDIAIYSLTHDGIADALIRAHERGVRVRVLMDSSQAGSVYADDERLIEAGVALRRDIVTGLMHHKFCISDGALDTRAVATGSFNWTKSADTRNMENFVILRLKYVVEEFTAEFERLWEANDPALA